MLGSNLSAMTGNGDMGGGIQLNLCCPFPMSLFLIVIGQLFFKKNQEKRVTLFPVDFRFKNPATYSQILFFCSMFN